MKKRVFLAILLSDTFRQSSLAFKNQFPPLPMKWTRPEDLHITLTPPWYPDDVKEVIKRLQTQPIFLTPFSVTFTHIEYAPENPPRLVWAAGNTPENLLLLKEALEKIVSQPPQTRLFQLHSTLSRFISGDPPVIEALALPKQIDWTENIATYSLLESHLSAVGPAYTELARFKLNKK